jgi:hypothetical protein
VTFVVTSGQLAALERSQGAYRSSVRVTDRLALSYADIWRTQPQVRTVVSFLARNIAQIGCHVYRRVSDTDRTRLTDHPLAAILAKPNPRTTRYRFFESLVSDLGIHDNAIWAKSKVDGQPYALIRLDPSRVTPLGDSWMWADGYRLQGNRGYRDFTPDQVVHFHGYNPADRAGACPHWKRSAGSWRKSTKPGTGGSSCGATAPGSPATSPGRKTPGIGPTGPARGSWSPGRVSTPETAPEPAARRSLRTG